MNCLQNPAGYTIKNPYAAVDWDTWNRYRTQLHAHTLYSDGGLNITDVVEAYYVQGYDILCITDHGVAGRGWNVKPRLVPGVSFNQILRPRELVPLSDERCAEIAAGADRGGRPMLDVKNGIEMNALVVRKNHVNGFFCGWGQNRLGKEEDYENVIAGTEKAGGISVINHPGDFFHAASGRSAAEDWKNLMVFADALLAHPSCVGVEAFNRIDTASRYDRVIWDRLLMFCIPRGRNVWAFSNDDSHTLTDIGLTAEIMLMPELSETALRTAMESGAFFACSKIAREELGEDFRGTGDFAEVKRVTVDEEIAAITVDAENADLIEWISDGRVIAAGDTLHLSDHVSEIGAYVRFQIRNEGGLLLSQPFICDDGAMETRLIPRPAEKELSAPAKALKKLRTSLRRTHLGEVVYRATVK